MGFDGEANLCEDWLLHSCEDHPFTLQSMSAERVNQHRTVRVLYAVKAGDFKWVRITPSQSAARPETTRAVKNRGIVLSTHTYCGTFRNSTVFGTPRSADALIV